MNTSGIGLVPSGVRLSADRARPGDRVLLSGTIGDHGITILSQREGLEFESAIHSDTAALHTLVADMLRASGEIRCLRDPTRGGLSSSLNEIAERSSVSIELQESAIPIRDEVQGACEMLGLDPLYVANEGKLVAIVEPDAAESILEAMHQHPLGRDAQDHRNGDGLPPRDGYPAHAAGHIADRRSALRRSVAENLLRGGRCTRWELPIRCSMRFARKRRRFPAGHIYKVGVRIGELAGVDPDAMSFCFEALVRGTELEPLALEIEYCPRRYQCRSLWALLCSHRRKIAACPECGMRDSQFLGGDELELAYLEVEDGARATGA